MKLFISWSGQASQQIAVEIRRWLPLLLPAVEPFITTTDIEKGARWQGEIVKELEESNYGIVCLTPQNLHSQWLAFEAGALSKHLNGKVATLLFDVTHAEVHPPLSMFQGTLFNEQEVRQLVLNINSSAPPEKRREDGQIERLFPMLWTEFNNSVALILQNAAQPAQEQDALNLEDVATEMLALLRQQNSILSSPDRFLAPVIDRIEEALGPTNYAEVSSTSKVAKALLKHQRNKEANRTLEWIRNYSPDTPPSAAPPADEGPAEE
ncbi:MAG: toll/interleukin-1 receptor domain-containing protein [Pseudorhizobium pelagicum]|uniref:toll/interleukin-1 receptor domain-containing protein n=1 Tax=Pseudorhizobium pelagicum TaxID=1509405 RepID=UPI00345FD0C9